MSDDRSAIIKSGFDATGVRTGAEQAKDALRDVAQTAVAEGRKASGGVEAIGEGAQKGAQKVERETGRIEAAIQRAQAKAQAGAVGTADYYEALARQRGANVAALQPALDALRQTEAAQRGATQAAVAGLDKIGVSARQTQAALRGVPAQFTDIVTSLASGQQPITVLLQQGGQLKDMFGGIGAAARALGGYILGLINPFTVLAGAAGAVSLAYVMGERESQGYARALIMSGNAAGTTAGQLQAMAAGIAAAGSGTQGAAAKILTDLAAAGEVGAANLERFAKAAIDLERAGGPAAEETAKAFAQLARDPLQASLKLTESTRYLTAATATQIAELERQGRTVEAARVAQEAYATALIERAPEMTRQLGTVERGWRSITDAIKGAGSALLSIGRADTAVQQLEAVRAAMERVRNAPKGDRFRDADGGEVAGRAAALESLRQREAFLQEQVRMESRTADATAQRVRAEEAGIKWLREGVQYQSTGKKLAEEILAIRNQGVAAGKSEAEITERIASAVERSAPKPSSAGQGRNRDLEQQQRLLAELSGVTATYTQDLKTLGDARKAGLVSEERYVELVTQLIQRQPMVRDQMRDAATAAKEQARATKEAEDAYARYLAGLDRNIEAGGRTLQQLRLELVELTAGKKARFDLEQQERERLAITYEQAAIEADMEGKDSARYRRLAAQVRDEIRLRRSVAEATDSADVRRANEKAAQDAARDWERTADQISQSLADAIFQGGKSAGDLLKGYFRTLVLQPFIKAQLQPVADGIGQVLGIPGAGGAAGSGSALGSLLGSGLQSLGLAGAAKSIGGAVGSVGSLAAVYMLGRGLGQAISGGYSTGGSPNRNVNLGLILGGPIGAVVGGLVNRLFGRKLKDTGFEGTFGAEGDFSGNAYAFYKGGLFRSNKTKRTALDDALANVLDAGGMAAFRQAQAYADVLGLPAEALAGYTQKIKVSLKGLSEEQAQEAVAKAVQDFQEGLLGRFSAQLQPLRRMGETLSDVAARISELTIFTEGINALGGVFNRIANLSIDARESLIAMAGGMDALNSQAQNFVQQYYSREEIAGVKAREIQGVLSAAGVTQDVATREQFRALVESADVSTATGREQLAQLLAIAGDFAQVADYLAETGGTLAGAAAMAPTTGALAEIFAQPVQLQVTAINAVEAAVNRVDESIRALAEMQASLARYSAEVGGGF